MTTITETFEAIEKATGTTVSVKLTHSPKRTSLRVTHPDGSVRTFPDYAFCNLYVGKAR
jgi:hypothetical protein